MDFQEVECVVMDWFDLAQDRDRWRVLVKEVMDWFDLAQDRDRWRVLVKEVMEVRVP